MAEDWAKLPFDLLELILSKLIMPDHIQFSCVCKSWNLAVKETVGCPKPSPWLMLKSKDDSTAAKFFSLSEKRIYGFSLPHPEISKRDWIGSSHGWLITMYERCEFHLLNPVTAVQIQLPDIIISPYYCYPKGVLSSAPSYDGSGNFTIILIYSRFGEQHPQCSNVAITRVGDKAWTLLKGLNVHDIIHHDGSLYGMGAKGVISIWERHGLSYEPRPSMDMQHHDFTEKLFVESVNGDLLVLLEDTRCRKIDVVRVDLDKREVVPISDLNDNAFFLCVKTAFSASAVKFPELRRNCIYLADNWSIGFPKVRREPYVMGVIDLKSKKIKPLKNNFEILGFRHGWPYPTWVIPTFVRKLYG